MIENFRSVRDRHGATLYDGDRIPSALAPQLFDLDLWQRQGRVRGVAAGRGEVQFIDAPFGPVVWRHYRRGGLVARFNRDRYWFHGEEGTRGFHELSVLDRLASGGLPVPRPLAARYHRSGPWYRADLMTAEIAGARTVAELIAANAAIDWAALGGCIAGFHARGLWHADLNAHNLLVDGAAKVWLIDFDRAEFRPPAAGWQQNNLARLLRSLRKVGAAADERGFDAHWQALHAAHAAALRDAVAA
jgi:3-deoxy-D-manno-octulosonic acid kinase